MNWGMRVLQTLALPLGYVTVWKKEQVLCSFFIWSGRRGSNSLPPPWQGGALPDELRPHMFQSLQATFVIITDLSQKVKGFLAFCSTFFQIFFPSRYPTRGLFQLRFPPRFVAWASQRISTFASLFLLCCILCSFPASPEANKPLLSLFPF